MSPEESLINRNSNRNRELEISRAPTKEKSREPAYSPALNLYKINRQRSKSRVRQADSQTAVVFGVETGREVAYWQRFC